MEYLVECMRMEARHSAGGFFLTVAIAFALGGLCWYAATQYTKLWNLRYNATVTLQVLCAIAAVLTLLFTIAFVSLNYATQIARDRVNAWHKTIKKDRKFLDDTYVKAYYSLKNSGLERFDARNPPPSQPGSTIPISTDKTKLFVGKLYADASLAHFRRTNRFLSQIIMPGNQDVPVPVIRDDMKAFFAAHRNERNPVYNLNHGVDITADLFQKNLESQTHKVVTLARRWITLLFLAVQLIPFGLIGYAAYRDLKTHT